LAKKTVLVLYEFFYPGYKAGGPVQSLVNMISTIGNEYNCKVITTAYDLNTTTAYPGININQWNTMDIEGVQVDVWYGGTRNISSDTMLKLIREIQPQSIFINGLYTKYFSLPLQFKKKGLLPNTEIIVSPRGMLQAGALAGKKWKKKIYLGLFKFAGLFKNIRWHATTPEEAKDIRQVIDPNANITVAANIPKKPLSVIYPIEKKKGSVRLVYLSVIAEKKNLLLLISVLKEIKADITLDIYGPVKDEDYWQLCKNAMIHLPSQISLSYKGDVLPSAVQPVLQQYHALVTLTRGENFGHALYESFSVGRPVITSFFTPWIELQSKQAGWNVDIKDEKAIAATIENIAAMDDAAFQSLYKGAHEVASTYYNNGDFSNSYRKLFT